MPGAELSPLEGALLCPGCALLSVLHWQHGASAGSSAAVTESCAADGLISVDSVDTFVVTLG